MAPKHSQKSLKTSLKHSQKSSFVDLKKFSKFSIPAPKKPQKILPRIVIDGNRLIPVRSVPNKAIWTAFGLTLIAAIHQSPHNSAVATSAVAGLSTRLGSGEIPAEQFPSVVRGTGRRSLPAGLERDGFKKTVTDGNRSTLSM